MSTNPCTDCNGPCRYCGTRYADGGAEHYHCQYAATPGIRYTCPHGTEGVSLWTRREWCTQCAQEVEG